MDPHLDSAAGAAAHFAEAVSIMERLRAPGGCPWDREQTADSIRPYTLEEVYEVFDAIERRSWTDLRDELGDLLLQVLFYSQIAADEGHFTIEDVIAGLNRKLIRRHPHVYGDQAAADAGNRALLDVSGPAIGSAQVLRNWDAIKKAEKTSGPGQSEFASVLDSISRAMPALTEARKLGSRAQKSGFDWPELEGLFAKLSEEIAELRQAIANGASGPHSSTQNSRARDPEEGAVAAPGASAGAVAAEIGDLLFTAVNLARRLHVDPEFALRHSNAKFRRRFAFMERAAPGDLETLPAVELESLWNQAKRAEAAELAR